MDDLKTFLETVITCREGWLCLALMRKDASAWSESWYKWPDDKDEIIVQALANADEYNVNFSSYLFSAQRRTKENALPTRTIQADLDAADIRSLPLIPTALVCTSKGRYQAYWVLTEELDLDAHEALSRRMTYSIENADHAGWPIGKTARVPGTQNHKYLDGPQPVVIESISGTTYDSFAFEMLPDVEIPSARADEEWVRGDKGEPVASPNEFLDNLRQEKKLPAKIVLQYGTPQNDRSAALWALMLALFRANCDRNTVYSIAQQSANNKFTGLRYNGDIELAKDVVRAEAVVERKFVDPRSEIREVRRLPGQKFILNARIMGIVYETMRSEGDFIHTTDNSTYYMPRSTGRPIELTQHSEYLNALMSTKFGLNNIEDVTRFCKSDLINHTVNMPMDVDVGSMSHYNGATNSLLLHTGGKDITCISRNGISQQSNGANNIMFIWDTMSELFGIDTSPLPDGLPWYDILFENCFDSVIDMEPNTAMALMRIWVLFIIFRKAAFTRPILAFIGEPGCLSGKTKVVIERGRHTDRVFTLEEAFYSFNGISQGGKGKRPWLRSIPSKILSLKDGEIRARTIKSIVQSGNKRTYSIVIEGRDAIRATVDHRFLTPTGYVQLENLRRGDSVIVRGDNLRGRGANAATRRIVSANFHPHARQKVVDGYGPYGSILYCRAVLEARLNGLAVEDFLRIVHTDQEAALLLAYLPADVQIHHNDEDPTNDSWDNLKVLSREEHSRLHGQQHQENLGRYSGRWNYTTAKVVSITYHGVEPTYDIEMEDGDAPNFLVYGAVVHNSGKSTIMRRLYRLFYGKRRNLVQASTQSNLNLSSTVCPFLCIDNMDTWEKWLPDWLATSIADTDIEVRKLYTDNDKIRIKRQAVVGLTAHNPKFSRPDVADRLLLLTFRRLLVHNDESRILDRIVVNRNKIWGGIQQDIIKVLEQPLATDTESPALRIADFATLGMRIAKALGIVSEFFSAVKSISDEQRYFTLEEEAILVTALRELAKADQRNGKVGIERPATVLASELEAYSGDSLSFKRHYSNPMSLSRKIASMQTALNEVFILDQRFDPARGAKLWSVRFRHGENNNGAVKP